jgi:hypothetical protein
MHPLVDGHPTGRLRLDILQTDRVEVGLLVDLSRRGEEVVLEAVAKVLQADDGVDNGEDDEKNGDDSKGSQRFLDGLVVFPVARLVDSDKLEDEVAETAKVEDDDGNHAGLVLPAGKECGAEEDDDGDGNGGNCQGKLGIVGRSDNDHKLDDEAEEEEEIELEKGDVNLVVEEALPHPVIGTDGLEDIPGEFLVKLPADEAHADSGKSNDGRNSHEIRPDLIPNAGDGLTGLKSTVLLQNLQGLADLVDLDGRVDQHGQVGNANTNSLDSILHAQGIPDDDQLVKETKDEERQKCRNGLGLRLNLLVLDVGLERVLKLGENIGFEAEADDGLQASHNHKGGGPFALEEADLVPVHARRSSRGRDQALSVGIALVVSWVHLCRVHIGRLRVVLLLLLLHDGALGVVLIVVIGTVLRVPGVVP